MLAPHPDNAESMVAEKSVTFSFGRKKHPQYLFKTLSATDFELLPETCRISIFVSLQSQTKNSKKFGMRLINVVSLHQNIRNYN